MTNESDNIESTVEGVPVPVEAATNGERAPWLAPHRWQPGQIALLYARLPANQTRVAALSWPGKTDQTFSDAITAVRRWLWMNWIFATPTHHAAFAKIPRTIKTVLLYALAPAA